MNHEPGGNAPAEGASPSGSKPSAAWVPPSVEELQKLLPQYQILQMLGRGGMGAVYKALQTSLDRHVAIKILSNALQEQEAGFTQRFQNEARAMAKLNHPGIVSVYDFGETATGLLYIVMEYVDGTDVSKMIASSGRLHSEHAMAIAAHVCDALAYAHDRGIIHRDIKPANIMVDYEGRVKVADFGLAKVTASQAQSGLTQSNVIMGTLHYMAPEALILGTELDRRADLYAVGVMLYEMLTGRLPQGLFEMPSLRVPGLDPRYDRIVATALRDDRELRYPSAQALRQDLDAILTQPVVRVEAAAKEAPAALNTQARPRRPAGQPPAAPPAGSRSAASHPPPKQSSAASWLGLAAVMMILGLGGIYWLLQNRTVVIQPPSPGAVPGERPAVVTREMVLSAIAKLCPGADVSKATVQQGSDGRFRVDVSGLPVTDFTPLHGLNIWNLQANNVPISDLSSVVGVGMATLWLTECRNLTNLAPLSKCATLKDLNLAMSPVNDLSPLRGLQLVGIGLYGTNVKDLSPLRNMPLVSFNFETSVDADRDAEIDLSPLSSCLTLERVTVPPSARNIESLRQLPNLQQISHRYNSQQNAAEFWAYYDRMKPWRAQTAPSSKPGSAGLPTESHDRACASWAIAIGAKVWVTGSTTPLSSEKDIPKADFKIEKLVFNDGNKKIKEPLVTEEPLVTASDMWRLEGLGELRWLDLRDNHIGSGLTKLDSLTKLQTLILHSASLGDSSLSLLGRLPKLAFLDLTGNRKLTDGGMLHLANLTGLEKLYLNRTRITDQTLNGVLASLPKLTYLDIQRTQVTEAGVQAFQRAKPGCFIKSDWPSSPPTVAIAPPAQQPYANTLGMKFVPVPGTKVMFCIHETRRQDYAAYASAVPGVDGSWKNVQLDGVPCGHEDTHPVVGVSWEDAQKFCAWLSNKEGKTYRLPTDEEWSIAVGLGQKEQHGKNITPAMLSGKESTAFPWDGDFPPKTKDRAGNYSDASRKAKAPHDAAHYLEDYDDGFPTTAPVMSFKPNKFGLYDLGGNVWEYCEDWYDNAQKERVLRGSSWFSHVRAGLLSSYRSRHKPSFRGDYYLGFRCVLEFPSETPNAPLKPAQNSTTVGPKLSEEMAAAAARGGRLRAWGNFWAKDERGGLRSIDVSKADGYSDFVALAGDSGFLIALRKNQALVAVEATDQAQVSFERNNVTGLFRDRVWPRYQVGESLFYKGTMPTLTLNNPATTLLALASGFNRKIGGFLCIPNSGPAFWQEAEGSQAHVHHKPPPAVLLADAANAVGISFGFAVVSKEGRLRIWNFEKVIETPAEYSDIIEIRGGGNFALCRKHDGSVLVWPPAGYKEGWLPDPGVQRVPSIPSAVQVRCGLDVCAAQMPDGRWIGWGTDAEVVAKISEIGKAVDIVIAGRPENSKRPELDRYVAWIEPLPEVKLPPELAALDTQFKALEKERVTVPYEGALAKLNNGYLASLQKAMEAEKAAGRLVDVAAFETDQKLLLETQPPASAVLPDADAPSTPEALKKLRAIWRTEHAKLLAARAASLKALVDPLEKRLSALEADLIKANQQADAKTVQDYRKALTESAILKNAAGAPAVAAADAAQAAAPQAGPSTPTAAAPPPANVQTNSLGMKFVPLPGTKVLFCIHETRRQDYAAFVNETPGLSDSWKNMKIEEIPCGDKDDHPVVGVSWLEARKFCEWLSAKEKKTYRLPTDVEWSDAVGLRGLESRDSLPSYLNGKVKDQYPWEGSHPPKTSDLAGNYADVIWHKEFPRKRYTRTYRDGFATTAPVMSFKPNLYGLYDIGGNAWEWIEDLWTKEKGQTDGTLRGGSFAQEAVPSSFRLRFRSSSGVMGDIMAGFRVVLVVE